MAAATINLRLAAVRRLAYEATDCGLLSPELAVDIQRIKGAKRLGLRIGNWFGAEQAKTLLHAPDGETMTGKWDRAILAVLLYCGLRRSEAVRLNIEQFQRRGEHWEIVDLFGKGGHIRPVPVPDWVKQAVDLARRSQFLVEEVWGTDTVIHSTASVLRREFLDGTSDPVFLEAIQMVLTGHLARTYPGKEFQCKTAERPPCAPSPAAGHRND